MKNFILTFEIAQFALQLIRVLLFSIPILPLVLDLDTVQGQERSKVVVSKSQWVTVQQSSDKLRSASVMIRYAEEGECGCSGVCVSADGKVMSAKHCQLGQDVTILFHKLGEVPAKQIYVGPGQDAPVVFQITKPGMYPSIPVSSNPPAIKDKVRYFGFPDCRSFDQFIEGSGFIEGGSVVDDFRVNRVSNSGSPGMSGGPPVNERGELVGLLHGSVTDGSALSVWLTTTAIKTAFAAANGQSNNTNPISDPVSGQQLVAFLKPANECPPCGAYEREADSGVLGQYAKNAVKVKLINGRWMECDDSSCRPTSLEQEFTRATGQRVTETPIFWVRGTKSYKSGYQVERCPQGYCGTQGSQNTLCAWLSGIMRGGGALAGGVVGYPIPAPRPVPPVSPVPISVPDPRVADLQQQLAQLEAKLQMLETKPTQPPIEASEAQIKSVVEKWVFDNMDKLKGPPGESGKPGVVDSRAISSAITSWYLDNRSNITKNVLTELPQSEALPIKVEAWEQTLDPDGQPVGKPILKGREEYPAGSPLKILHYKMLPK